MFLCMAKERDTGDWIKGYIWTGTDCSYMIPYNYGVGYVNDRITACAYAVIPETIISLEVFVRDVSAAQCDYRRAVKDKRLSKTRLCEICVPIRDKYGFTDMDALALIREERPLSELVDIYDNIKFHLK